MNTPSESADKHRYTCPKCGCEFTRQEGELEVCKCSECDSEVNTREQACNCC